MLPLYLLKKAQNHPMLVEVKNGETYNGHLVKCDTWMNIHLREDGDRFWRMPECYIRGNTIKTLQIPIEVIHKVQEETNKSRSSGHCSSFVKPITGRYDSFDRKQQGVGRGRGREGDGASGSGSRPAKGIGRGGGAGDRGMGRGQGRSGPNNQSGGSSGGGHGHG